LTHGKNKREKKREKNRKSRNATTPLASEGGGGGSTNPKKTEKRTCYNFFQKDFLVRIQLHLNKTVAPK
jgi:hypothetical protein